MPDDVFIEICMLVAAVVLFIQSLAAYLIVKYNEKIHKERMKEIRKKEQV